MRSGCAASNAVQAALDPLPIALQSVLRGLSAFQTILHNISPPFFPLATSLLSLLPRHNRPLSLPIASIPVYTFRFGWLGDCSRRQQASRLLTAREGACMRAVRVDLVTTDSSDVASQPDHPMDCSLPDMVFPLEEEDKATLLPWGLSAAAAASTVHQLHELLAPSSDAELRVSPKSRPALVTSWAMHGALPPGRPGSAALLGWRSAPRSDLPAFPITPAAGAPRGAGGGRRSPSGPRCPGCLFSATINHWAI